MANRTVCVPGSVLMACIAGATALGERAGAAGPMPIARRTAGILASDLTLDKIYLLKDLNGDGDAADDGELTLFFDGSNASGVPNPTGVFSMFQSADGTVYIGDGDTDTIYALLDRNGDGDALDATEARVYFSGFNESLITIASPNGIAQDATGAVYISNAGQTASPQDGIYWTKDMNGDGDALDAGEQRIYVDTNVIGVSNSGPLECSMIGDAVYFVDPRGGAADVVFIARDADASGTVDASELGIFFLQGATGPVPAVPVSFACQTDGTSIFVHESSPSQNKSVWKLTDTNGNRMIDMPSEAVSIWDQGSLSGGIALGNIFSFSFGPGKLALSSNGADAVDEVVVVTDLNNDGDFNDAGGASVLIQGTGAASFPENIRVVLFYGRPCPADVNGSGDVTVQDIFDFLALYFASDPRADFNASGSVTVQDIFDFLAAYFVAC